MKHFIIVTSLLLIPVLLFSRDRKTAEIKPIRVALSCFDDSLTAASENEKCGPSVAACLEKCFMRQDRFFVRPMGAIKEYLDNLARAQLGLISPEEMKGDPTKLKVDYLTVGSISKIRGRYEIDARTVNIDNMDIVYSCGCTSGSLDSAIGEIRWNIKERLDHKYLNERETDDIDRPTVTVYNFRDYNQLAENLGYGGTFAEMLNSQLGSFATITTIERKYSRSLINEKILEMAGVIENDDSSECFSDKGIQYKVEGNIRVFDDVICLNYRLCDTSDDRVVFMSSKDISTINGFRPVCWYLSNTIEDVLNNRIGTLKITSSPGKARVYVDGKCEGTTPLTIPVKNGTHEIAIKKDEYIPFEEKLTVEAKNILEKNVSLKLLPLQKLHQAMNYERRHNWRQAILAYDSFIKEYEETEEADSACYRKGYVEMYFLKNYRKALKTFRELVSRYPDTMTRSEGYLGIMQAYACLGQKQKALETKKYLLDNYGETFAAEAARRYKGISDN